MSFYLFLTTLISFLNYFIKLINYFTIFEFLFSFYCYFRNFNLNPICFILELALFIIIINFIMVYYPNRLNLYLYYSFLIVPEFQHHFFKCGCLLNLNIFPKIIWQMRNDLIHFIRTIFSFYYYPFF